MKMIFKYDVLHIKPGKHLFNKIIIFFNLTFFKQLKIEILKPLQQYFSNPLHKTGGFKSELLPGRHRKKNKLTWEYIFRFFIFQFTYFSSKIIQKSEYRKILKRKGLLA